MALWSRVRKWLLPAEPEEEVFTPIPGHIDDWNELDGIGMLACEDTARLRFDRGACTDFLPLIGLHVEVMGVGVPPENEPYQGMFATRLRLCPGRETEYAALLRIQQVERAAHGRLPPSTGQPPWAREKGAKRAADPSRPRDAFFVLTILLSEELPYSPELLADMLRSRFLREPQVRLIPLSRNGKMEAGFSAEIQDSGRRAFLLYRPTAYEALPAPPDGQPVCSYHVGLFVGGPHSPRVATLLGDADTIPPLGVKDEVRLLSDLARSILKKVPAATGLLVNRAGRAIKPRDTALLQLGNEDRGDQLPWLVWIDWNVIEEDGRRLHRTVGMESLALPDVGVLLQPGSDIDRSRMALWYVCQKLVDSQLNADAEEILVPRAMQLKEGSRLEVEAGGEHDAYVIRERDHQLLLLEQNEPSVG